MSEYLVGTFNSSTRSRKKIRDCPLITAGLGRGCPDSSYDMDDTVFTGRCNTLTILSDKRFDISGLSLWEAEVVRMASRFGPRYRDIRPNGGDEGGAFCVGIPVLNDNDGTREKWLDDEEIGAVGRTSSGALEVLIGTAARLSTSTPLKYNLVNHARHPLWCFS